MAKLSSIIALTLIISMQVLTTILQRIAHLCEGVSTYALVKLAAVLSQDYSIELSLKSLCNSKRYWKRLF